MRFYFLISILLVLICCILISSCSEDEIKYHRYFADGSQLYKTHCENCHMKDGKGLANIIPPLTDSVFLKNKRSELACYISYGLNDTIVVNGEVYDSPMPAEKHLTAIDIAKVLTYITNSFGNKQGIFELKEVETNISNCL